ncbi:MAG: CoA transferase [Oligoflexia bacterium]|nr:CoA transferase [Oligoflexia bacterium]
MKNKSKNKKAEHETETETETETENQNEQLSTDKQVRVDFLKGVRVIVVAHYIPGPLAAYLLKGMGAEIIKVEPPFGDLMRQLPPFFNNGMGTDTTETESAYFKALNGGFKSMVINFKTLEGIEIFKKLIKKSDVIIDGNRANYLEKILSQKLEEINSEIIHLPITAYGLKGPLRDIAGHDNNILAIAGNLSYCNRDEEGLPAVFGSQLADITAGYLAAFTAVSALFAKKNNNSHLKINTFDNSMLHAAFFLNQIYLPQLSINNRNPLPAKELLNGGIANYKAYKTKDNKAIFFGPIEPALFKNFLQKIEREDLIKMVFQGQDKNNSSGVNQNEINSLLLKELKSIFIQKTRDEWMNFLKGVDCCVTPVNTLSEAVQEEQICELSLVNKDAVNNEQNIMLTGFPVGFTKESLQPVNINANAPLLGEHTKEILEDILLYDKQSIANLYNSGTIK